MDLNKYRSRTDTEHEWQMKKLFLERYHDQFGEDRLLCMAQCYVNIETLGCRYPNQLMQEIKRLTSDFEPVIKERLAVIDQELRKNAKPQPPSLLKLLNKPPGSNKSNSKKTTDSNDSNAYTDPTKRQQKLISKTQLQQIDSASPPVTILSRNKSQQAGAKPQRQFSQVPPPDQPLNFAESVKKQQQQAITPSKNKLKAATIAQQATPSAVPASTSEQAPSASLLPIPGFNVISPKTKNVLASSNSPGANILSSLLGNPALTTASNVIKDEKFSRLNRINKLRDSLRASLTNLDKLQLLNQDPCGFLNTMCQEKNVSCEYIQFVTKSHDRTFYGEIVLETFRLCAEANPDAAVCKLNTHRRALDVLIGKSELAVRQAPSVPRSPNLWLDTTVSKPMQIDYELYKIDDTDPIPPPTIADNLNGHADGKMPNNISDLNALLKSMILPKENKNQSNNKKGMNGNGVSLNDEDDEDREEDKLTEEKKNKLKQHMPELCIFLPSNFVETTSDANIAEYLHDRNALQVLGNSCTKSRCNLEFEIKTRSPKSSRSIKTKLTGAQIESESNEADEGQSVKCKCIINGLKISSAHSNVKQDAKRKAALKSLRYLVKVFPIIKEMSYKHVNNNETAVPNDVSSQLAAVLASSTDSTTTTTATSAPSATYFKISKEQLFGGLVPPTMFETDSLIHTNGPSTQFGTKNF